MIRIGTRGSDLARTQTRWVAKQIEQHSGNTTELVIIRTQGDRVQDKPFHEMEGRGFFTKELEEALLSRQVDVAVHSLKDMPTEHPAGLQIAALSAREDPSDLLVVQKGARNNSATFIPLSKGAVVGTSSIRRSAQLLGKRPDLSIKPLRGNVPTRLGKLADGEYDAILLASAGVNRLGIDLSGYHTLRLDPLSFIPAPGQGALAIQVHEDNKDLKELLHSHLHSTETETAVEMERSLLALFGGGCGLPLGGYAIPHADQWKLFGFWGGGKDRPAWAEVQGAAGPQLAETLADSLRRASS